MDASTTQDDGRFPPERQHEQDASALAQQRMLTAHNNSNKSTIDDTKQVDTIKTSTTSTTTLPPFDDLKIASATAATTNVPNTTTMMMYRPNHEQQHEASHNHDTIRRQLEDVVLKPTTQEASDNHEQHPSVPIYANNNDKSDSLKLFLERDGDVEYLDDPNKSSLIAATAAIQNRPIDTTTQPLAETERLFSTANAASHERIDNDSILMPPPKAVTVQNNNERDNKPTVTDHSQNTVIAAAKTAASLTPKKKTSSGMTPKDKKSSTPPPKTVIQKGLRKAKRHADKRRSSRAAKANNNKSITKTATTTTNEPESRQSKSDDVSVQGLSTSISDMAMSKKKSKSSSSKRRVPSNVDKVNDDNNSDVAPPPMKMAKKNESPPPPQPQVVGPGTWQMKFLLRMVVYFEVHCANDNPALVQKMYETVYHSKERHLKGDYKYRHLPGAIFEHLVDLVGGTQFRQAFEACKTFNHPRLYELNLMNNTTGDDDNHLPLPQQQQQGPHPSTVHDDAAVLGAPPFPEENLLSLNPPAACSGEAATAAPLLPIPVAEQPDLVQIAVAYGIHLACTEYESLLQPHCDNNDDRGDDNDGRGRMLIDIKRVVQERRAAELVGLMNQQERLDIWNSVLQVPPPSSWIMQQPQNNNNNNKMTTAATTMTKKQQDDDQEVTLSSTWI